MSPWQWLPWKPPHPVSLRWVLGVGDLGEQGGQASGEESPRTSELKGCGRMCRVGMDFCKVRSESGYQLQNLLRFLVSQVPNCFQLWQIQKQKFSSG